MAILEYQKLWRQRNPEKFRAIQRRYLDKPEIKEKKRGWQRNWSRAYYKKYPEKRMVWYWKWRASHPYKYAKHGTGWYSVRIKVLERDNYICIICGKKASEVHHWDGSGSNRPRKEMNNSLNNLVSVCHRCHTKLDLILHGGTFYKGMQREKIERNETIINMLSNMTQTEIAKVFGLTRQRIGQICRNIDTR